MKGDSRIQGSVASGRGLGRTYLAAHATELDRLLGLTLYPGSLNVLLKRPVRFRQDRAISVDNGLWYFWPGRLNGREVWLYRWKRAPLHVIEIVAPVNLRSQLELDDGDVVDIDTDENHVSAVSLSARCAWATVWLGRSTWYYSSDRYYHRTAKWCGRLGATQEIPRSFREYVDRLLSGTRSRTGRSRSREEK